MKTEDRLYRRERPPDRVAVRYRPARLDADVDILTRSPRTLEGASVTVRLPHLGGFEGTKVIDLPRAYAVPGPVAAHLALHGLAVTTPSGGHDVEVATVESHGSEAGRKILEAGQFGDVDVTWRRSCRDLPEGYRVVSTEQPLGAIAVYLCEPESDDGLVENNILEAPGIGHEFPVWRIVLLVPGARWTGAYPRPAVPSVSTARS